jgi:hypothetical protein
MRNFFDEKGRTRVFGPRKAGQEGVQLCTPQTETRGERMSSKKGPFMDWKPFFGL